VTDGQIDRNITHTQWIVVWKEIMWRRPFVLILMFYHWVKLKKVDQSKSAIWGALSTKKTGTEMEKNISQLCQEMLESTRNRACRKQLLQILKIAVVKQCKLPLWNGNTTMLFFGSWRFPVARLYKNKFSAAKEEFHHKSLTEIFKPFLFLLLSNIIFSKSKCFNFFFFNFHFTDSSLGNALHFKIPVL